jgi:hypothetical protein
VARERIGFGEFKNHANRNNDMVTIKLTHFAKSDFIRWRPETYKGTEFSNYNKTSRWATWKPSGLYLGFGNEYMDWRFKGIDAAARVHKDMITERNWNFKHQVTIECNEDDIYIVNTIDDLPNPKFDKYLKTQQLSWLFRNVEEDYRKNIGKTNGETLTNDERDELIQKCKMFGALEHYQDYHAWDELQENYKAVYITQHFFDNYKDVYDLHMRQVIVFDTSIIVESETYGELFNYREYVGEIEFDWNWGYISLYNYFYKELMSNEIINEYYDMLDDDTQFSMIHVDQSILNKLTKDRVSIEDMARKIKERRYS